MQVCAKSDKNDPNQRPVFFIEHLLNLELYIKEILNKYAKPAILCDFERNLTKMCENSIFG